MASHATSARDAGVYVLLLRSGAYYVGKSGNISARIAKHTSAWVQEHGGVAKRIQTCTAARDDWCAWEQDETLTRMRMHGFDNVRGFEFVACRPLEATECATIKTMILGSGDLCRKCGRAGHFASSCRASKEAWLAELEGMIAERQVGGLRGENSKQKRVEKKRDRMAPKVFAGKGSRKSARKTAVCARCGRDSHASGACFARKHVDGWEIDDEFDEDSGASGEDWEIDSEQQDDDACFRCGRPGHWAQECFAKTDVRGRSLLL